MHYTTKAILILGVLVGLSFLRDGNPLEGFGETNTDIFRVGVRDDSGALESSIRIAQSLPTTNLPRSKDLSGELPPIYHQGDQASSSGFVLGYYLKSYTENRKRINPSKLRNWKKDSSDMQGQIFSPRYIYNATNDGKDLGGSLLSGLILLKSNGILPWNKLPYREDDYKARNYLSEKDSLRYRIDEFYRLIPTEINQIKAQLNSENPIPVSLLFFKNYLELGPTNLIKDTKGEFIGAQAVLLVGYDDSRNAFLAVNSWGESWGDNGKFWIDYKLFQKTARSAYLIVDRPTLSNPAELKNLYPGEIAASQGNYKDKVRLSWDSVPGAIGYEIHRKRTVSSKFQLVGISLENQFEDSGVQPDLAYHYRIASVFPDETSDLSQGNVEGYASNKSTKNSGESITGVIASRGTFSDRVILKWNPIPGKKEYHVYKFNPYAGQYRLLAKTSSNDYVDRRARRNGEIEFYRISVSGSFAESRLSAAAMGYTSNRSSVLPPPQSISVSKGDFSDRIELNWEPVNGADSYKVYRYTDNSKWEELSQTTENRFVDTTLKDSQGYYSIITYSKLGLPSKASFPILGILSDLRERALSLPPPTVIETKLIDGKSTLRLTWKTVQDATEYRVYSRSIGGSWKTAGSTKSNYFQEVIPEKTWKIYAISSIDSNGIEGRKSREHSFGYLSPIVDTSRERSFGQESKIEKFKGPWTTMYWDGKASVTQVKLVINGEDSAGEEVQIFLNNRPIYKGDYIQETKILDPRGRFNISLSETETSLNMEIRDKNIFPENTNLSFLRE